jgi:hypothetical protein
LGGAVVAVTDDASSAETNPSALTTLSKLEVIGTVAGHFPGEAGVGDLMETHSTSGFLGLAGPLTSKSAIGLYFAEPHSAAVTMGPFLLANGSTEEGYLDVMVRDFGASLAWHPVSRLHLGVQVVATHLSLAAAYGLEAASGAALLQVNAETSETRVTTGFGILFEPSRSLRVALVHAAGARWPVARQAVVPLTQTVLDAGSEHEIRQPTVTSGGLSLQLSRKVLLAGQVDYVRFPDVQPGDVDPPGSYVSRRYETSTWEPRLGLEISIPRQGVSFQLRAGLHGQSTPRFTEVVASRGAGPEIPPEAAAVLSEPPDPPSFRVRPAVGGSMVIGQSPFRLDMAFRWGGEQSVLATGLVFRF